MHFSKSPQESKWATRKVIGFKSLRLNSFHVNYKSEMSTTFGKILTYCLTQSYLLKRWIYYASATEFSWEIYQKQPPLLKFFRNSHRRCFMKKVVLKIFVIFTGKLQTWTLLKNKHPHRCFPLNIAKFSRTPVSKNICSVSSCFCIDSFIKFK